MTTPTEQRTLIDEIDERQSELLDQLDDLNLRVEGLLSSCLQERDQERAEINAGASIPAGLSAQTSQLPEATVVQEEC